MRTAITSAFISVILFPLSRSEAQKLQLVRVALPSTAPHMSLLDERLFENHVSMFS
jgi:hypothetical protein